jgi:hypothetical protein
MAKPRFRGNQCFNCGRECVPATDAQGEPYMGCPVCRIDLSERSNPFLVAAEQQAREILAHREKYLKAWIAETGLMPSECELVEELHHDGTRRVYVRRRTPLAERTRGDER